MKHIRSLLLVGLFLMGVVYLGAELAFSLSIDRSGFGPLENTMRFGHMIFTAPLLLLPIVQFSRRIRVARPGLHRRLGQLYLFSAVMAAFGALYLGFTFEDPGRRPPLVLFAVLWLFFSAAAWVAAVRRDFRTHAHFVTRSYGVALAFVFVRVLGQFESELFGFMPDPALRGVTREWVAFVVPLLLIETAIVWVPAMRRRSRPAPTRPDPA